MADNNNSLDSTLLTARKMANKRRQSMTNEEVRKRRRTGEISTFLYAICVSQRRIIAGPRDRNVIEIRTSSGADIELLDTMKDKSCMYFFIEGTDSEIASVFYWFLHLFSLNDIPALLYANSVHRTHLDLLQPEPLPLNEEVQVKLLAVVKPWHIFVMRTEDEHDPDVRQMYTDMDRFYRTSAFLKLPLPLTNGAYCAIEITGEDGSSSYQRAIIEEVGETGYICIIKLLDIGGYMSSVHGNELYEIKEDFMKIPFQAIECGLFGVKPLNELCTSNDMDMFSDIVQPGVLYARRLGEITSTGQHIIYLVCYMAALHGNVLVNKEIVDLGLANYGKGMQNLLKAMSLSLQP